jgi:nitronate monooxygenase
MSLCPWPATHRAWRNRTFVIWDAAGCPPPGKRPGEGEVLVSRADGSKVRRYWYQSPVRDEEGAITQCALYVGRSVDVVKDLPTAGELVKRLWQECETAQQTYHRLWEIRNDCTYQMMANL